MLLNRQTQLAANEVIGFKLITGEELVGKVISVSDTEVTIKSPHILAQTPQGLALAPAIMTLKDGANPVYTRSMIVAYYTPDDNFKSAYESASSGLVLPGTNIV